MKTKKELLKGQYYWLAKIHLELWRKAPHLKYKKIEKLKTLKQVVKFCLKYNIELTEVFNLPVPFKMCEGKGWKKVINDSLKSQSNEG